MTTLREAAQQALEALDRTEALLFSMDVTHLLIYGEVDNVITALRAALAEPVQEPVDAHTTTLRNLLECCLTWKLDARVLGNVTARQAITALRAALAQQEEPKTLDEALTLPRAMAQAYEAGYNAGVAHEREACAKLAESTICNTHLPTGVRIYGTRVADAIRARENT